MVVNRSFFLTNGPSGYYSEEGCGTQLQMMSERLSHRTNTFLPQESVTTALETLYRSCQLFETNGGEFDTIRFDQ